MWILINVFNYLNYQYCRGLGCEVGVILGYIVYLEYVMYVYIIMLIYGD